MIRLVYVLRRLPSLSFEDFQRHLQDIRGPLVASHSTRLRMRRCVQSYFIDDPANEAAKRSRGVADPYDAVEEIWFNNPEEATAAFQSPEGQRAAKELLEDEREFVDFSRSSLWFAIDVPQVNPTPENIVAREENRIVKTFYPLRHLRHLSLEEAQLYWRMNHGPLIRSRAAAGGTLRYIQVHMLPIPLADALRAQRGTMEEPYTGHAELWHDRLIRAQAQEPTEAARARASVVLEDEAKFIDFSRSSIFMTKERIYVDR